MAATRSSSTLAPSALESGLENIESEKHIDEPAAAPTTLYSKWEKTVILSILCSAQFWDIFNAVSTIIALPEIQQKLDFDDGALQWVVTAYTLTFASFLLFAGRLADIYHPKPIFSVGYVIVGLFSLLCAVSVHPIMLLVFRAVQGIGAALTFPSAIALLVQEFPEPAAQGRALAAFAAFGAIGNVAGFIIGGVLAARATWRWIFYLVAIAVTPMAALSIWLLPRRPAPESNKKRSLDWQGVVALAGGLILFVYAISDGNERGWGKPQIIVTLIFSIIFILGFFIIERTVDDPAVPPSLWKNQNFLPLFLYCWSIYWFLNGSELQLIEIFQDLWGWSPLSAATHCIPIGIAGGISSYLAGTIARYVPRRMLLLGGQVLVGVATILFALADTPDKYWSHILPGMIVGMIGLATGYVGVNIFIMAGAREGEEGVVGAMMNTAFQLGATVGLAVLTAVKLGVNKHQASDPISQHKGYEISFWSLLAMHGIVIIMSIVWVRDIKKN